MSYQVSQQVQKALDDLTSAPRIQKALSFMEADQEEIIQRQMELALIPAPTFHEEKKARRLLEMFKAEGLEDCHIDEYGNCVGLRRGTGGGRTVLLEGHMDTVFSMDTQLKITREDGWIHCPGIVDDTRGCVTALSVVRALNVAGIRTKGDIHVVGTVQEEGMGALRGMKYYVNHHPELEASVSIDGDGYRGVIYRATGIQTAEITFRGKGGHAYIAFGEIANPAHAAGRAVVVSSHDHSGTPPREELIARLRRAQDLGADLPKLAVTPRSPADVLTLLSATEEMARRWADRPIITMSMAADGVVSRLCGEIYGSAMTFGAAGQTSAPGQLPVEELRLVLDILHRSRPASG